MEKELKIRYRLYAINSDAENVKRASNERFCRITPFYILIYTNAEIPQNGIEMTQSETHRLSAQDEQWLRDCNIVILAEQAKIHEAEIAAETQKRLDKLEEALLEEREKQEE